MLGRTPPWLRRTIRIGVSGGVLVFLNASTTKCDDTPRCIEGIELGDRVKMTVIERYDGTSRFPDGVPGGLGTCNETVGLGARAELIATARRLSEIDGQCTSFSVDLTTSKFELTRRDPNGGSTASAELQGDYTAVYDGRCRGRVFFGFRADPPKPNLLPLKPVPGQRPAAFVFFDWLVDPGQADCPATCQTKLVVEAEKL
jgi:hypothetical protein